MEIIKVFSDNLLIKPSIILNFRKERKIMRKNFKANSGKPEQNPSAKRKKMKQCAAWIASIFAILPVNLTSHAVPNTDAANKILTQIQILVPGNLDSCIDRAEELAQDWRLILLSHVPTYSGPGLHFLGRDPLTQTEFILNLVPQT
jgi:hypothetical protein